MIEKELREIKRRFRPEKSNIMRIVGCFVNSNKQIIARISQPLGLSDSVVSEMLLGVMKKTLSGSLGTNLNDVRFSTKDVLESDEHKLIMTLRSSALSDNEALESFYSKVIESLNFEGNYVILLANDVYDVPARHTDGEEADSTSQFSYIVCAVCPLKDTPGGLSFHESDSLFHSSSISSLLSSPELGFMFPAFDDRQSNIYSALYYTRSVAESYPAFTERVFGKGAPMPPKEQKAAFSQVLSETLGDECDFNLVRSVHAQVGEMVVAHKESRDPEPLVITKSTAKTILSGCGIDDEKLEKFGQAFDESFGTNAAITPKNIVSHNRFELSTPEVSIKIDPEHRDLVSTQTVNGEKYIMIRVSGGVSVNGIDISLDD
ncbi:MAG: DUF4317 domain-containing protein [Clostridia bacterium]|nr:DUF4317 domain-containing protein [Clostridia bacterium]